MKHNSIPTPNPITVLLRELTQGDEIKTESGIILKANQGANSKQLQVVAIGSKIDKGLNLTPKSKVIVTGGLGIVVDNISYTVAKEDQIVVVIN